MVQKRKTSCRHLEESQNVRVCTVVPVLNFEFYYTLIVLATFSGEFDLESRCLGT